MSMGVSHLELTSVEAIQPMPSANYLLRGRHRLEIGDVELTVPSVPNQLLAAAVVFALSIFSFIRLGHGDGEAPSSRSPSMR